MVESIVQIFAGIIGYAAARGIDAIIGKWLAYFIIAWEDRSSQKSKDAFAAAMKSIKESTPAKAAAWESWRKRAAKNPE